MWPVPTALTDAIVFLAWATVEIDKALLASGGADVSFAFGGGSRRQDARLRVAGRAGDHADRRAIGCDAQHVERVSPEAAARSAHL